MDCERCEELLSDVADGTLAEPLASEAEAHLASCAGCAALLSALREVTALASLPASEPEPPFGMAERVAARSWRARIVPAATTAVPRQVWVAAACLTMALSGAAYGIANTSLPAGLTARVRTPARYARRAWNTGVATVEKGHRLVEDLRILRLVLATAFESRADRVNDKVEDYRQLMEKRRRLAPSPAPPGVGVPVERESSLDPLGVGHAAFIRTTAVPVS